MCEVEVCVGVEGLIDSWALRYVNASASRLTNGFWSLQDTKHTQQEQAQWQRRERIRLRRRLRLRMRLSRFRRE